MAAGGFGSTTGSAPSQALIEQKLRAEQMVKNGAGWFLARGGLSILNSVLTMSGTQFSFIIGLGTTQIVDVIGRQSGTTGSTLGLIVNLFIAGVAFHAYALFRIYNGMQGVPVLEKIRQALAPAGAPIEPR
jgi:hypothetical protein